ncbi:alpha/beta fold hydrolase [Spirillospora sp. CA-255316]
MTLVRTMRPNKLRLTVFAAVLALVGVMAMTSQAVARPSSHWDRGVKPVIVLEHGAWADASGWGKVVQRLQENGFTVYAPPNLLRGLPQDSAYLHAFLTQNAALAGRPVVLVAHSYGGAVITNAAVGVPQVKALVYVDAFIPDQEETIGQLAAGSCLVAENPADIFTFVPYPGAPEGDVDLYIKPSLVPGCFATGLPARQAAVIAASQRPLVAGSFGQPSGVPAWKTIPSWAVIGTGDRVITPAQLTFMARRAGAHTTSVDAGHLSMISKPETVAWVIEKAARATS